MRIEDSARRHGIPDEAMLHAVRMVFRIVRLNDGVDMYLGADQSGTLLEVGVVGADGDDPRIIHAMPMRGRFYRYL